ncbi:beta-glucosidase [Sedimentisphaera salicampi]|uniref:beta-glucosidase n=1 Tax=Sedimentisphaera salicampi TaxID=1941349 RepID=UPI000B9CD4EF|nr:beta-glucosidase [Sedimentisphaera salicampi]OXU15542.1 Xylan 1,4-beta-xylosidase precursor [Sedimentisphaera salicampi]
MKKVMVLIVSAFLISSFVYAESYEYPFRNPELKVEDRIDDLLSRLTVEEKAWQMVMNTRGVERLEIPSFHWWNECLHGVARAGKATVFPQAIALASTWNTDLMHEIASAISDEARGKYNSDPARNTQYRGLTMWSPTINIARDPRWGRTEETYGEDPYLTGCMGYSFITGLQGDHPKYLKVAATPKHFVANNIEAKRHSTRPFISERALREYYLPAFEKAVTEAKAESIMSAYNGINNIPCSTNKWLLEGLLRYQWGFDGSVVTDVGVPGDLVQSHRIYGTAPETVEPMIEAGVNVIDDFRPDFPKYIIEAYEKGMVNDSQLDKALYPNLRTLFRLGFFDPPEEVPFSKISKSVVGCDKHISLARQAARESIVLLKNDKLNGKPLLPIDTGRVKRVAVLGTHATENYVGGYSGTPVGGDVSVLEGLKNGSGQSIAVKHVRSSIAMDDMKSVIPTSNYRPPTEEEGEHGLRAEYYPTPDFQGKPFVRTVRTVDFDWGSSSPDPMIPYDNFSAVYSGKLIPNQTGVHTFLTENIDDGVRLYIDGKLVLDRWQFQIGVVKSKVRLKAGEEYDLKLEYREDAGGAQVHLYWREPDIDPAEILENELELAEKSDLVVVALGLDQRYEFEGRDKNTLAFPSEQLDFLKKVYEVNQNVVVVLQIGSPMAITWMDENIPAIVNMWYPGEQGGNGLADILFGKNSPSGKLPATFFASDDQLLPWDDYEPQHGRTYMYFDGKPLYPFGYGLSYTDFAYSDINISKRYVNEEDNVTVKFTLENIGSKEGAEVVQLYASNVESPVYQPKRQLKRFKKVNLMSGQSKTLSFDLEIGDLNYWDSKTKSFIVEPGEFEIMIGSSSADIELKESITVK